MKLKLWGKEKVKKDDKIYSMTFTSEKAKKPTLEKHSIKAYQLHDYLKKNAIGYQNRIKSNMLMKEFDIKDNKTFRKYIQEIRQSKVFQKIICSEAGYNGGYWIATNEKEVNETLDHLYNRAMEMLKTYSDMKRKAELDGQYRMKFSKYEKEIIESVVK